MLEIEFTDIIPQPTAFSAIMPGLGWATSAQLVSALLSETIFDGE